MTDYSSFSDQELIVLLKNDNHDAFTEIYHRYKHLLFTHAYQRIRDEELVQDILHDLFTNIWLKRTQINLNTSLLAYLFTAVRNKILDYVAHQRVESAYISTFAQYLDQSENATDHLVRENQLTAMIEQEIDALPPKMREVFLLSRKEHLNYEEIAKQLGITKKTVKNQINNALKILRSKLKFKAWLFLLFFY